MLVWQILQPIFVVSTFIYTIMKKITRYSVPVLLAVILFSALTGCKKYSKRNGVLEIRNYTLQRWDDQHIVQISDGFQCVTVGNADINLAAGEVRKVVEELDNPLSDFYIRVTEYVFHEKESPNSLGYTKKYKDANPAETPFGTFDDVYVNKDNLSGAPGSKGAYFRFAGKWKHEGTGLVLWIDGDNDGKAVVVTPGSAFPEEATGGYCMTEINHSGSDSWTGKFHTYFPGSGWRTGSTVGMELSDDRNTFTLGGEDYVRQNL